MKRAQWRTSNTDKLIYNKDVGPPQKGVRKSENVTEIAFLKKREPSHSELQGFSISDKLFHVNSWPLT